MTAYAVECRTQGCAHWFTVDWSGTPRGARLALSDVRRKMRAARVRGETRLARYDRTAAGWHRKPLELTRRKASPVPELAIGA